MSKSVRSVSKYRPVAWLSPALLIVALALGAETGKVAYAEQLQNPLTLVSNAGPTQFILRAPADRIEAIAARYGLTVLGRVDGPDDIFLVSGPAPSSDGGFSTQSTSSIEQLVETIEGDPEVATFEPNAIVVTPETSPGTNLNHATVEILDSLNDRTLISYFGQQVWQGYKNQPAANAIRLGDAQASAATGAGIVAIIDTGVDPEHPLLQGSLVPGYDFINDVAGPASEWSDIDHATVEILDHATVEILDSTIAPVPLNPSTVALLSSASTIDPALLPAAFGHGTMVAGIVHLVAPTARIMPLKAFRADGTSRVYDIVRAIYYAVDHGARVINMSFSASVPSSAIASAINYATDHGVICVASAGNLGRELVVYPGGLRNVLGVASSSSTTPPTRSAFSNFGDALVSLAAPGEGIITTYPGGGYAGTWGTSFAAPLVAGGAALLLQIDPTLNFHKANDQFAKTVAMSAGMGRGRLNLYEAVRTLPDVIAPAVSLLTPASTGTVSGEILISASASDNIAVTGVKFLLDGSPLGAEDSAAPYELTWPTTTAPNGNHVVTAIVRDAAGNVASSTVGVTLSNDFEPPAVSLTSPALGAIVGGTVMLTATATDDIGVVGVQFKLDGAALGAEDVDLPYELAWSTEPVADGLHTLTAVARDAAGKETSSAASVTVTHDVTAPTVVLSAPVAGATVAGAVTVTAIAADDVGIVSVQLLLDGAALDPADTEAPYEATWSTAGAVNGPHTLTAVARDAAGHVTTASAVSVTVMNDMTAPTVGLTSPAGGATVEGTVTVSAAAADDIGVTSVQLLVDGAPLGAAVVTAPYQVEWSTATVANGAHTLSAVALDAAGRETTATGVVVNVRNDLAPPTVVIASPAAGVTIEGTVNVTATAVDDVGVISVQFLSDGVALGDADTEPPYAVAWPTTTVPNGTHTVTAVARDGAGRESTADLVSVLVVNDAAPPAVTVTGPAAETTVSGIVTLTATASDDVGVAGLQFQVDGAPIGVEDSDAPYEVAWSTAAAGNGAHTVTAVARDASGRQTANSIGVTVLNDLAPPTVAITSPNAGATVSGAVTVGATATDDIGVSSVQFLLDGAPLGAAVVTAPYQAEWSTTAAANGAHTLAAVARDAAGRESTVTVSVAVVNDAAPPTVSLTGPTIGTTVNGTVTVAATAADDVGVSSVQFLLDGAPFGTADTAAPYQVEWPTTGIANGSYTLTAVARDAAGQEGAASAVTVTVLNDLSAPTVALTSPAAGTTVSGTVTLTATAADDIGVSSVQFLLDGASLGAADTTAPYEAEWPTATTANGDHTLTVVARDAAGRETTTTAIGVAVLNDLAPPTVAITSPNAGATVSGAVTVGATATDDIGVSSVQFLLDGAPLGAAVVTAPYQAEWSTTAAANGAHTLAAVARDAAGRESTVTVSVAVLNDAAAPTVTITGPPAGATVAGTATVTATAADDVGVSSVQFSLDGAPLGAADTAAPYQVEWPTTGIANGSYTLTAVARDAAGHETTTTVSVTVLNDAAAPTVALTSPVAGTTVSGTVTLTATAADDIGVSSVQFLLDGATLGTADTMAPYEAEWPTAATANGDHALTAVARDAVGRETTTTTISVAVLNDLAPPTVAITSPNAGTTVVGAAMVTATAADDLGVSSVQFLLDGAALGAADTAAPYEAEWLTTTTANGAHTLAAVARDASGRETTTTISVAVLNDLAAPTVTITGPTAGTTVAGTATVTAAAADDVGVSSVRFRLDGAALGAPDTAAPYEAEWLTTTTANGAHTLAAVARDSAGRETTTTVSVAVLNDAAAPTVTLTGPTAGTTVAGKATVTATALDDVGVSSVQFLLDGAPLGAADTAAPYQVEWFTTGIANGSYTLTVVARDAAGQEGAASPVSVAVLNDHSAPTVALTSPAGGTTVSGMVTVTATAADDFGVSSVQFLLDGAPLGAADTAAPYDAEWPTAATANGDHALTAVARDAAGHETTTTTISVAVRNDLAPPTVAITSPSAGTTVGGAVTVAATATDDIGVSSVQFLLDGAALGAAVVTAPYQAEWSTTAAANGAHTLAAVARDASGRESTVTVSVAVLNDAAAPTVTITGPPAGTTVAGTATVTATAADDVGVSSVQFLLDGAPLGAADTAAPYQVEWPTTGIANGSYTLTAVARDAAGHETTTTISVAVRNDLAPPTVAITSPSAGTTVAGTVTVTATAADDIGVSSVQFLVDGATLGAADTAAPYEAAWSTTAIANGSYTITAVARDAAGQEGTASAVTVTILNDLSAPTVTLTSPAAGTTVSGTVTLTATAADDIGVSSVQFLLDGAPLGAADTAAPYDVEWPTATTANGDHTLTAVARDAAGRETTTTAIGVAVLNDLAPPTVAITSPNAGATVSGAVTVAAAATDDIGVSSVQFLLDGAALGTADTTAPYEAAWLTGATANGDHVLTAVARDAAGRETTTTTTGVAVLNDLAPPTVAITSPNAGATVSGAVTVAATATDDIGVSSVQFLLDGAALGAAVVTAPYQAEWSTTAAANGAHTLAAVARDAAGRESTVTVSVAVLNDAAPPTVTITGPPAGTTVAGTVTVTATAADDIGVSSVQFLLDGAALGAADTAAPYEAAWSTATIANGSYTLTAVARDAAGQEGAASAVTVTVLNDLSAPTVALTSPAAGTTVSGTVTLTATAADDIGVSSVQFLLDGASLGAADTTAPYEAEWPTATTANGDHTLTVVARDAAGRETTTTAIGVAVLNDLAPPTVAITSPNAGATVSGAVTVGATATDDIGVSSVQFLLDGAPLGAAVVTAPYQAEWSTTAAANGAHTLAAVARDAAGRESTVTVSVAVLNDAAPPTVTITGPPAGTTVAGTVAVTATAADDIGVSSVQFLLDGAALGAADTAAPYEAAWSTATIANGSYTLTAVARDAAGQEGAASAVTVTVLNDLSAPTVALTSPAAGTTVSGTVTLTATAADDIGVSSVQFLLDGASLGAADTTAPYEAEWLTGATANGDHTLTAVARDAAGRETTTTTTGVAVLNDLAPPTVAITSPNAGATVSGAVTVAATATDDIGVSSVQFLLDGAALGAAVVTAPYQAEWSTTAAANGAHTLAAVARDAAGRESTVTVSVAVLNDAAAPTVTITGPPAGTTVDGTVTVTATAADDVGVSSVQFLLDGAPLGAADTAAPYEAAWSTTAIANGSYTLTAVARDAAGQEGAASAVTVTVLNDLSAPTVALTSPAAGTTVSGTVTLTATAADDIGVSSVQFLLDGASLGAADTTAPYEAEWLTGATANGDHTLTAVARDAAGHETATTAIGVAVLNDLAPPVVAFTTPTTGTTASGIVTVVATAADDIGVSSVQFLLDGTPLGAAVVTAPYQAEWSTTAAANGAHTLAAVARDASGRESTATVSVAVVNDAAAPTVTLTGPAAGTTVAGTVTVTATAADDVGVSSVQFLLDGAPFGATDTAAPYQVEWATAAMANGSYTLSAVARDAAGQEGTTSPVSVTVLNDLSAPTVAFTSPAAGPTVTGIVTVAATAADDLGVSSVQFLLDGAPLGTADTTAPYEAEWLTDTTTNGDHALTAVARDAAGHETTATISVSVLNDLAPPTAAFTSPTDGATVSGSVSLIATAVDDVAVSSVQFRLDGAAISGTDPAAPYETEWLSTTTENGAHTLSVVARDTAGRVTTTTISLVVLNDTAPPTVAITSPAPGMTFGGTVTITAAAADDVGITNVQFLVDGVPLGPAVTVATATLYSVAWATESATNGSHTLTAVASDASGRQTTTTVNVEVLNEAPPEGPS